MTWILEFLFGPAVPENPNFEVIQDVANLVPWWYPHFVVGCMLLLLALLFARRHKITTPIVLVTALLSKLQGPRSHGR